MREAPGTRFTIERARTSWKVIPRNSGVSTVRVITESAPNSAAFSPVPASPAVPLFPPFSVSWSQRMAPPR